MDDGKIIYDSNEIESIVSKIGDTINIVQNDIYPLINNGFSLLEDLDLFSNGLDKLKSKSDKVLYLNNILSTSIKEHDNDYCELDNKHLALFDTVMPSVSVDEYSGASVSIDDIILNKINDGKVILTEYVKEVIPSFSYDKKVEVLKSILSNDDNSLSILTNQDESDIMVYKLKNVLSNDYDIELNKLTKEEEKEIQESFFESIIDNDTNIFDEIESNSFLGGLQYYKQVAKKNGISTTDLIFDDENQELFMNTVNEIYSSDNIDVLTDDELNSVKNYIKETANKNSLTVTELLSSTSYSSVIKGGIYYED